MSCAQAAISICVLIAILPIVVAGTSTCECNAPSISSISYHIIDDLAAQPLIISWQPNLPWNNQTSVMLDEDTPSSSCEETWQLNFKQRYMKQLRRCRIKGNSSIEYPYVCPRNTRTSCYLSHNCYQEQRNLDVRLVGINNACRKATEIFKTLNIPDAPKKALPVQNLTAGSLTSRSVIITWTYNIIASLTYPNRVYYYNVTDHYANIIRSENTSVKSVNLHGLMPYTRYMFLVCASYIISSKPNPLSDGRSISFLTLEDVPGAAPGLSSGSYSLCGGQSLTCFQIYYQDIPKSQQHGEIISYSVNVRSYAPSMQLHNETWIPSNISNSKVIHLRHIPKASLENGVIVDLRAATSVGFSAVSSELYIANPQSILAEPEHVSAEMHINDMNETSVHVYWNNSAIHKLGAAVQSCTVHYCEGLYQEASVKCRRDYHFETLPGNATSHIVYLPSVDVQAENYRFGISVMTNKHISTGITWSDCLYMYSREPEAPPYTVQNITDSEVIRVLLKWKHCQVLATLISASYQLYHEESEIHCEQGTVQNASWSDMANTKILISHLLPLRSYVICIRAYGRDGPGPWSAAHIIKTTQIPSGAVPLNVIIPATVVSLLFILILLTIMIYYCRERLKELCKDPETVIPEKPFADDEAGDTGYYEISDEYDSPPTLIFQTEHPPLNETIQREVSIDAESDSSTTGLLNSTTLSGSRQLPISDKSADDVHSVEEDFSKNSGSVMSIPYFTKTENGRLERKTDEAKSSGYSSQNGDSDGSQSHDSENNSDLMNDDDSDIDSFPGDINLCDDILAAVEKKDNRVLSKDAEEHSHIDDALCMTNECSPEIQQVTADVKLLNQQNAPSSVISDSVDEILSSTINTNDPENNDFGNNDSAISANNDFGTNESTISANNDFANNDSGNMSSENSDNASYSKFSSLPDIMTSQNNDNDAAAMLLFMPIVGDSHVKYPKEKCVEEAVASGDSKPHISTYVKEPVAKLPEMVVCESGSRYNRDPAVDQTLVTMKNIDTSNVQNLVYAPRLQNHTDYCLSDVGDNTDGNIGDSSDDDFIEYRNVSDINTTTV